jgi:hypothetical protein
MSVMLSIVRLRLKLLNMAVQSATMTSEAVQFPATPSAQCARNPNSIRLLVAAT